MKKHIMRATCILSILASVFIYTGCNNDDDNKVSGVQLKSFGPSGVLHEQEISIIGENLDQVTSVIMPVNVEVPKSSFTVQTPTMIKLLVPIETTTGKVILKTPAGDIESKTIFGLEYQMVISALPAEAKPGSNLTITGDFLKYVKEVWFAKDKVVTEFVSQSRTELVVKVPMDAQTGKITLSDGVAEEPQLVESEEELIITLPEVTMLAPLSIKHGENVTITGNDLDLVTEIIFSKGTTGTKVSTFVSKTLTQLVVKVPDDAQAGKLILVVPSLLEVETSNALTIILPVATNVTPITGVAGTDITITGTNLDLVEEVIFPDASPVSTFISHTATQIVVDLPSGVGSGGIEFVTVRGYQTQSGVAFGADPSPLIYVFFDDAFTNSYSDWSWGDGRVSDPLNTEKFKTGTKSWKMQFPNGDGGLSWGGGTAIPTTTYTKFSFSVFGAPGTNGNHLDVVVNDTWSGYPTVTIVEGVWTEYDILLSNFVGANATTQITRIILRSPAGEEGTVWVDKVGFK